MPDAVQVLPAQVRRVLGVPVLARVQVRRVTALARVQVLARMTRVRAVRSG